MVAELVEAIGSAERPVRSRRRRGLQVDLLHIDSQLAIMASMSISYLVQEARRRAGLTQAELARRAGVPKSTVGRIESGARTPSTRMVERLVHAAGLQVSVALMEPDPATEAMFERTLRRSPKERLEDATRVARFVLRGRREVASSADGQPRF